MEPNHWFRRLANVGVVAAEPAVDQAAAAPGPVERLGLAESFDDFYRCRVDNIYRALAVTLGNDDLAREAADEAMTRAYANWRKVSEMTNPAGWVFQVGLNWATSWWRKTRREQAPLNEGTQPGSRPPDPSALAARAAVERLPLSQRSVVVCRVLLELSTAETAATLAISEGTVKSRLARALAALRQALKDDL